MLSIIFGDIDNSIYHPPTYFDNVYMDEWIVDDFSKEIILDVDKSVVVGPRVIDSPYLGSISTKELSGGVKTLMLMMFDEGGKIFNASACGDNCAKWIVEISKRKDLTINLHHVMDFSSCKDFEAIMLNTNRQVKSYAEYLDEALLIKER